MTRIFIGLVLLLAVGAKLHQLRFDPASLAIQGGILASKWAVLAVVEAEMLLAVCLLLNLWRRAIWRAALLAFCGFAGYSAGQLLRGAHSCGCAGAIVVHPRWTFLVDTLAIACLLFFPPQCKFAPASPRTSDALRPARDGVQGRHLPLTSLVMSLSLPLMLLAGSTAALHTPSTRVAQPGIKIIEGRFAVVEPNEWLGRRLPLLRNIDVGDVIATGTWKLLLYRNSCSLCRAALRALDGSNPFPPVALIEVPPFAEKRRGSARNALRGRLLWDYVWILEGPVQLRVVDGVVLDVVEIGDKWEELE